MRIKIITNPRKRWAQRISSQLRKFLPKAGHVLDDEKVDASICIGGDGTILYANHMGLLEGKILGIGGKTSYICQLRNSNWKEEILQILEKNRTEKLMGLKARVSHRTIGAINDFVIHTPDYRVLTLSLYIDGKRNSFEGDGIIVSTALGSAAYAYSAGGKKLMPASKKITIVPICPYLRKFKPIVLDQDSRITISCDRESALVVDGIFVRHLRKNERVEITRQGFLRFFPGVGRI